MSQPKEKYLNIISAQKSEFIWMSCWVAGEALIFDHSASVKEYN